jgi:hypothetical protein
MDEYARQTGKAHFDLATCERVLDESELLSDILLETAETSKDGLELCVLSREEHECKFSAPFDKNGIKGKVVTAMSSMWDDGCDPSHLVEHPHDGCTVNLTQNEANSWVSLDLGKGRSLVPNYYCARHGRDSGYFRLRSWNFEGSNDGSNYTVLRAHRNDNSLPDQAFSVAAWEVEGVNQAYRYFRIRMTGPNSNPHNNYPHSCTACC